MKVISIILSIVLAGALVFWLVHEVLGLVKVIKERKKRSADKNSKKEEKVQ